MRTLPSFPPHLPRQPAAQVQQRGHPPRQRRAFGPAQQTELAQQDIEAGAIHGQHLGIALPQLGDHRRQGPGSRGPAGVHRRQHVHQHALEELRREIAIVSFWFLNY